MRPVRYAVVFSLCAAAAAATAGAALQTRTDLNEKDAARVKAVTRPASDFSKPEPFETMTAGAATSRKLVDRDAFSHSSANLTFKQERDFQIGNALFHKIWVSAPSSTQASDGLGPLFNLRACQHCHLKDGRGRPPEGSEEDAVSMFLRLSVPPRRARWRNARPCPARRCSLFRSRPMAGSCRTLPFPACRPRTGWCSTTASSR